MKEKKNPLIRKYKALWNYFPWILKRDDNPHFRRGVCQELAAISHKLLVTNPEIVNQIPIFMCLSGFVKYEEEMLA